MSYSLQVARAFASFVSTALVAAGIAVAVSAQGAAPGGQGGGSSSKEKPPIAVVNINTGTSVELQTLPGVGAATATRIIEYRQKNGGFKKIEDLMNVRGIGEKTFLKLKPLITIAPPKAFSL